MKRLYFPVWIFQNNAIITAYNEVSTTTTTDEVKPVTEKDKE